jgi:hypothetical protein
MLSNAMYMHFYFFAIQPHLCSNLGTKVCSCDKSLEKDDFWAPLGTPRFSFFLQIFAIH